MRIAIVMCAGLVAVSFALAGCGGSLNCSDKHPGPGCWEADQERMRKEREEAARKCKRLGLAYVDGAADTLGCNEAQHQCSMPEPGVSYGCGEDWVCDLDDNRVCTGRMAIGFDPPSKYPSYCARCADRALMDRGLAPLRAKEAEFAAWKVSEQRIADGEVNAKACTPAHRAALDKARAAMEAEYGEMAAKQRGELVASLDPPGAPLPLQIDPSGTWEIMAVSTLGVELDAPKLSRAESGRVELALTSRFAMWKVLVVQSDGLQQEWRVRAHGCVLWSLLSKP